MITLTTVGNPPRCFSFRLLYNFSFTANFVIGTGENTKLSENIILLCEKRCKGMSLATLGCIKISLH